MSCLDSLIITEVLKTISNIGKIMDKNDLAILLVDKAFEKSPLVRPIQPFRKSEEEYPRGKIF